MPGILKTLILKKVSELKRTLSLWLIFVFILSQMPTAHAVGTSASCAILMEAESGRVLYEHNAHQPRLIASITKLMTALVALESGFDLQRPVTVPEEAIGVEGSSVYLQQGEQVTGEMLLYGMLLKSGNDAATALAYLCADSLDSFAELMNRKAARLGMKNSHFENPHGLNEEGHYSSAYDMALLARACLQNKTLAGIVSAKYASFGSRSFRNHNKLLWNYEGCIGLKTGYTEKAGRTLVSAAEKNGMTLIAVTLNAPDDWNDHAALYNWGFQTFTMVEVTQEGAVWGRVPVSGGLTPFVSAAASESLRYPLKADDRPELGMRWNTQIAAAPVEAGSILGTLYMICNGQPAGEIPLTAVQTVHRDLAPEKQGVERFLHNLFF